MTVALTTARPVGQDYRLDGPDAALAVERGLAEAEWYTTPVPRDEMRRLLERRDGPAIRDTLLWFALLAGFGTWGWAWWGSAWAAIPFALYGVIYGSTSDSRWHEAGHGTAFRTDWMNRALYEIASFMVLRESIVWRWSHTRHHSDTLIVGRDPEISVPRPPKLGLFLLNFVGLPAAVAYVRSVGRHCAGRMTPAEASFIPASEHGRIVLCARIHASMYLAVGGLAAWTESWLPLMYIGLPNLYGAWLMSVYGKTQHAGLAENVLDHRLNCRTVRMNAMNRYLYWNMNYHVEHHMFPLVPYHALPRLHERVKADMPAPYEGLWDAWREIVPAILRQRRDPGYCVRRRLPPPSPPVLSAPSVRSGADADGWAGICADADLQPGDLLRVDVGRRTFVAGRAADGAPFVADGLCTHGHTHLAGGLLVGDAVECPKHNGRFRLTDGAAVRPPACRGLCTYPIETRDGRLWFHPGRPAGAGARPPRALRLRVVDCRSVSTFIRELTFDRVGAHGDAAFEPGDYLQFDIPEYGRIPFAGFDIPEPYATVWRARHVFGLVARHPGGARRNNYSFACDPVGEPRLRFNVRLATPPPGQDCPPGVGSPYMFSLRPGDEVDAFGPYGGDFRIRPTQCEMVYIGGGAGMAPIRSHLDGLFGRERTSRRVSFWYGARSRQEIYYDDVFSELAARHRNFSFHVALSSPLDEDRWTGERGMIHEVVRARHLAAHPAPAAAEYYVCGPPPMVRACLSMLAEAGVPDDRIARDEF